MKQNILAVYERANDEQIEIGLNWYRDARALASQYWRGNVYGAGIIAALSPMLSWDRNAILASTAMKTGIAGGCLGSSCAKANRILMGEHPDTVLGGDKVRSFWHNIAYIDSDMVTIDRHAYDVAMGVRHKENNRPGLKGKRYQTFVQAYRDAAADVELQAYELQAITWEVWRSQYAWKKS